jgi:two-component system, chemotaxis family, chemotaxis protein CheY
MTAPKPKILVLNDDPDLVEAMKAVLMDEGYDVESRVNRSVEDVEEVMPQLVLIDCPPDGFNMVLTFMQRLRLNKKTAPIPILLGISSLKHVEPAVLRDQRIQVLVRPFELDDLINCVSELLREPGPPKAKPKS